MEQSAAPVWALPLSPSSSGYGLSLTSRRRLWLVPCSKRVSVSELALPSYWVWRPPWPREQEVISLATPHGLPAQPASRRRPPPAAQRTAPAGPASLALAGRD